MARSNGRGRHAAPTTSFSTIATRAAVATVSATAVISASMTAANADSAEPSHAIAKVDVTAAGTDVAAITTPEITVSADAASWTVAGENAVAEVEATEPAPEPVVRERRAPQPRTSRTAQRQAPAQQNAAPAQEAPVQAEKPAAAPVQASGIGNKIVAIARQYSGTRYVHGGRTPAGWDCSGFTSYVYAQVGISLPASSRGQAGVGHRIPASEARPGDLLYWPGHVGIYTGNGMHIAARNPKAGTYEGPIYGHPVYIRVTG